MKSLANAMSNLKVLVLAGSIILVPAAAMAQQEVSPDIYPTSSPKIAQNAKPVQLPKKQSNDAKKAHTLARTRQDSRKKIDDPKLVAGNHAGKVTLAQAR